MNHRAVWAIYRFEMAAHPGRTIFQSIVSPVLSTALYFVVFGAAIGSKIPEVDKRQLRPPSIVPGLIMMTLPDAERDERLVRHLFFPASSAPSSRFSLGADLGPSRSCWAMVGAAATKSIVLGPHYPGEPPTCSSRCGSSTRS